ncbi:MAG: hypothetical protein FD187_518 [bacterium]|nr:MAG: hypothetical protein FD142_440 [bacterium]KAF0150283.1 MAG: hypothetical protein FD187_518 [bacterium]KAF0169763.1 MAG: hypothetical protein FD158_150 [bacterium]TXT20591.1 MAG: hypothetical protein FD132_1159 [bacterium]
MSHGQNNDFIRQYAIDEIVGVTGKNESPRPPGDGWRGKREQGDRAPRFLDAQPETLRRAGTAFTIPGQRFRQFGTGDGQQANLHYPRNSLRSRAIATSKSSASIFPAS